MEREETTRQQKVGRQIQKDLSDIFLKEARSLVQGTIVTVSKVRVSPDLGFAKIYLSVFPFDKSDAILATLQEHAGTLRFELGKRVKNQLRIVPEIAFAIDDSLEYVERIEKLIQEQ
ncbi:30S ribosome-binding factor RbfA [uncultured Rikenella sp.]|uniref:30S ribosome-binding factor RbfA n=1 Tax=uncultured Rikenella sp. TaxID=368003 RepID=UPI0025E23AE4|nr:30S ribosome-binding factor RbfA [uncultured Rikenella sp.]